MKPPSRSIHLISMEPKIKHLTQEHEKVVLKRLAKSPLKNPRLAEAVKNISLKDLHLKWAS